MRPAAFALAAIAAIVFTLAPTSAQHAVATKFDLTKPLTLKGTVTQIDWANPYTHIVFKVPGAAKPVIWAVELESPIVLAKNGWSQTAVQPGDVITVQGFAARDGSKQVSGKSVVLASGKSVLVGYNGTSPARTTPPAAPTPRWPDGHPRLGPATADQTGYWGNPSKTVLVQDGANVEMDAYGLLKNIGDVDKVAPMQKWARDVYELRQKDFLASDPMYQIGRAHV